MAFKAVSFGVRDKYGRECGCMYEIRNVDERIHHRFVLAVLATVPAMIAAADAWPVRAVQTHVEIASAFGLAASGVMLAIGVYNVAAWSLKRSADKLWK
jgi:hypothetical protein